MRAWLNSAAALGLALAANAFWASPDAGAASPRDKAFTVGNYPVEAEAKDAVTAKDKAHADGQQAAFRSLLKRIVPVTSYNRLDRVKASNAAQFADGVSVRSERNSSTTYIAALDFSFQADLVRDLLRREGVPFIDEQAPQIVLVPVMRETAAVPGAPEFRPASSAWSEVWKGLDLDNTVTPVRIEALKPGVHSDTVRMMIEGGGDPARILWGEYQSDRVLAAVAEVDQAAKRLHVVVAGVDAVGPVNWKRSYRLADGDVGYAMELAAVVTLGVLEGRWKSVKSEAWGGAAALSGPGGFVQMSVEFASLAQWNDIRRELLDTPGVDDLAIGAVSARSAEVSLRYPGGAETLSNALARRGLAMQNDGGYWLLRSRF